MPVSTYSSVPRNEFRGYRDVTPANLTMPVESLPIRLPLHMGFAPWGEYTKGNYVNLDGLTLLYGADVVKPKSPFFSHQSQFIRSHYTAGGKNMFLRLKAKGAEQASFRLAVDLIADEVPTFERNGDNSLKLDADGNRIPTGEKIPGFIIQHRWIEVTKGEDGTREFGNASKREGKLVSSLDGDISELIPLLDGLARFEGSKGGNLGLRLMAPTTRSVDPADEELQDEIGARIYRLAVVSRDSIKSTANTMRTLQGAGTLDFTFKKGTIDLNTDQEFYIGKVFRPAYESVDPQAFTGYGPVEKIATYDANIVELLTKLSAREAEYTGEAFSDIHNFNFLTGTDINGNPYHTLVIQGPQQGGILFSELSNQWMVGGSDGDISPEAYNTAVDELLGNLSNSDVPFKDIARMPFDSVWDTGFPLSTKLKFSAFHAIRPDVMIHACTQDVMRPLNTASEDSSIAIALRSTFRASQESSEWATKALRFFVMGNAGYLINDDYDGLVPFLEFLSIKATEYMGAENGEMINRKSFSRGEQTVITRYRDHNAFTRDIEVRNTDWNNGMNYAEYFDMSRQFWAGLQTIHEDHTSIFHSYMIACIACNLARIGHITWREMSGDDQLPDAEFLDMVRDKVIARTTGKYDDRVDITPRAYMTSLDDALGFPWHLDIEFAGDNIRTVQNLAIIAQRRRNETTATEAA